MKRYVIEFQQYGSPQQVTTRCNSIQFINRGTSTVTIDRVMVLNAGEIFTFEGNINEITERAVNIAFGNTGTRNLIVVKKIYV